MLHKLSKEVFQAELGFADMQTWFLSTWAFFPYSVLYHRMLLDFVSQNISLHGLILQGLFTVISPYIK